MAVVLPKHPYQVEHSVVCTLLLLLPVVHSTLDQEEAPEIVVVSKFHRQQIRLVFDTFQLMRFRNRIEIEEAEVSVDVVAKREDSEEMRREELGEWR